MSLVAATLAGKYSLGWAVVAGLIGGIAFLVVVYMGLAVRMTRMNFLYILGSMMAPRGSKVVIYTVGFMAHMMLAAGFGLVHAAILHGIGLSSVGQAAGWDLLIGAIHGMIILAAMPMMLSMMHPLVRTGQIERPSVALVGFGGMTPLGSLMAHAAFGVVTGAIYAAALLWAVSAERKLIEECRVADHLGGHDRLGEVDSRRIKTWSGNEAVRSDRPAVRARPGPGGEPAG